MSTHTPGDTAPRRSGSSLIVAGLAFGGLGLITVLWAAAPVLETVGPAISDQIGALFDWQLPAWVGKLLLAAGFFIVAGLLLLVGSGKWLVSAFGAGRRRRAAAAPGAVVVHHHHPTPDLPARPQPGPPYQGQQYPAEPYQPTQPLDGEPPHRLS